MRMVSPRWSKDIADLGNGDPPKKGDIFFTAKVRTCIRLSDPPKMSSFQLGKILKYPPFSSRSPSVEHDLRILRREKSKNSHHLSCTHECLSSQWFKTVPRPLPRSAAERLIYEVSEVSCENSSCAMVESVAKIIQEMLLPL